VNATAALFANCGTDEGAKSLIPALVAAVKLTGPLVAIIADAQLPDPGHASIVPTAAVVGSVLGGAYGFLVGGSAEDAERLAFAFGLLAAGAALLT
jgi:hypothetical protein